MSGSFTTKLEALRARLGRLVDLEHPYTHRAPREGVPASVLFLLSLGDGRNGDADSLEFLVTRRTDRMENHKGQYALPGGIQDPEDADAVAAALRENEEEMGIPRECVDPIGCLPSLWTPTGFLVTPVVALLRSPRDEVVIRPSEAEIDVWFWCDLLRLSAPGTYRAEEREIVLDGKAIRASIDVFEIDTHRIWGVTGAILKNFMERWQLSESESSASLRRI
jgi:8-oxo-dGTP pyrophosphatase MutT (NUDIX family)